MPSIVNTEESLQARKNTLVSLQWVLVIVTSYFVLFTKGEVINDPRSYLLIVFGLAFMLVLYRLPVRVYEHKYFAPILVIMDTLFTTVAIGLNRENPWDLFIVFYFGLFIAAIGESLLQIVAGCFIITIVSVVLSTYQGGISAVDPETLIRVPFIFGVSLLYGYLGIQVKKEKKRAERAEETQQLKRQLVSALAHDIKNPLGVIMFCADTVATRIERGQNGKKNSQALHAIQENVERIVKLVTGFLDASKAESGKMEMKQQPVNLTPLIQNLGQQQMEALRKKNISLNMDLHEHLPDIMGDEAQLERVLWNLVANAIKFTPSGGTISIGSRVDDGHVSISVNDTGMGIPEDALPQLFTEFRRLKGSETIEGTGLGLFIVKTIVEAHGGTVHAESKYGDGSKFIVRLPKRP
jgi:signal transduction histidine kinase